MRPLVKRAEEEFGLFGVKALSLSDDGDYLEYKHQWHMYQSSPDEGKGVFVPVRGSLGGLAVESGKTVQVREARKSPRWAETDWSRNLTLGSMVTSPIFVDGSLWGVLCGFTQTPVDYSPEDLLAFEALAQIAGAIVARASVEGRLSRLFLQYSALNHDTCNSLFEAGFALDLLRDAQREREEEEVEKQIEAIRQSLGLATSILKDWNRSVSESGNGTEECDLLELMRLRVPMHRIQAEGRKVGFLLNTFAGLTENTKELRILAAPTDVDRVLQCFLSNALKYCRRLIRVELVCDAEKGEAGFRVEDDGEGIPHERRDRVFEPFVQLPGSLPGEGFGLASARFLVLRNGGRIGVNDSPENGASFLALFPLKDG
ncbi:MAG: GAF domain-containing sensor histidine kinase [bacterium]